MMKKTILAIILLATISTNYIVAAPGNDDPFQKALYGKNDDTPSWWKEKATNLGQAALRFTQNHPDATRRAAIASGLVVTGLVLVAGYKRFGGSLVPVQLAEPVYKTLGEAPVATTSRKTLDAISNAWKAFRGKPGHVPAEVQPTYKRLSW